jgi:hypothetical protein
MNSSDKHHRQSIITYGFLLHRAGSRAIDWGFEYHLGTERISELSKICDMVDRECFCLPICVPDEILDIGIIKQLEKAQSPHGLVRLGQCEGSTLFYGKDLTTCWLKGFGIELIFDNSHIGHSCDFARKNVLTCRLAPTEQEPVGRSAVVVSVE